MITPTQHTNEKLNKLNETFIRWTLSNGTRLAKREDAIVDMAYRYASKYNEWNTPVRDTTHYARLIRENDRFVIERTCWFDDDAKTNKIGYKYPAGTKALKIDSMLEWLYQSINNNLG